LTSTEIKTENLSFFLLKRSQPNLLTLGHKLVGKLPPKSVKTFGIEVKPTEVEAGSGSLPLEKLPSAALQFNGKIKAAELSRQFRMIDIPVLGYIKGNKFHIDLKAVPPSQEKQLLNTLKSILS
jgi:L-seryl-tRNA(Ser) seleniumtransferase